MKGIPEDLKDLGLENLYFVVLKGATDEVRKALNHLYSVTDSKILADMNEHDKEFYKDRMFELGTKTWREDSLKSLDNIKTKILKGAK